MARLLVDNHSFGDGLLSLELEGPVDLRTVPGLRKRLLGTVRKRTIKGVLIDLSRVSSLDTSGVAMLVEIWRALGGSDGVIRLTGLSDNARRLIHLARLDQVFVIRDDPRVRI
jgi:anti-sigma B factor antagonist